ncbi:MAG: GDSL-type esterase/lipase family protein [Opitutaceae bacterium]|jgi:lysophospholipase L1-like esterase
MSSDTNSSLSANDPTLPVPRQVDYEWMSLDTWNRMHREHVETARRGEAELLVIGDSITEGWRNTAAWGKYFGAYKAANFGIGGDETQNLLWRLENGAVGNLKPKVVVLLIGTNNIGRGNNSVCDVLRGIGAVLARLRGAFPSAKILLLGIFPADQSPQSEMRRRIVAVNASLPNFDDGATVFVRDIGHIFLEPDDSISPAIMPDFLHLAEEGYRRWAELMAPMVSQLMEGQPPSAPVAVV